MSRPTELLSKLKRSIQPPPEQNFTYAPWSGPGDDEMPSTSEARLAGDASLARSSLYSGPTEDEAREATRQANAIAEAQRQR